MQRRFNVQHEILTNAKYAETIADCCVWISTQHTVSVQPTVITAYSMQRRFNVQLMYAGPRRNYVHWTKNFCCPLHTHTMITCLGLNGHIFGHGFGHDAQSVGPTVRTLPPWPEHVTSLPINYLQKIINYFIMFRMTDNEIWWRADISWIVFIYILLRCFHREASTLRKWGQCCAQSC